MPAQVIKITGARQHNLKNLHVEIPREKLVVITGLSGSGKSSLAFDTLYAEGQRRYVESLSAYARQFLDKMEKPDVDFIEGLSPAIAIEQRSAGANPRSTIATTTEIYDYLRVLFSAVGQPHDPVTGKPLVRQTPQQIVDQILAYPPETKIVVLAPIVVNERGEFRDVIEKLRREGFVRARIDGEILELGRPEPIRLKKTESHTIEAVVDRLIVRDGVRVRLADSIDTALKWGGNRVVVLRQQPIIVGQGRRLPATESASDALAPQSGWEGGRYSTDYGNADSGFTLGELTPKHFSFNSHFGACPACHGLGTQLVVDPELMISDQTKTLAEGAITPWRRGTKRMRVYYRHLQDALIKHFNVNEDVPFADLPEGFKAALYFGTNGEPVEMEFGSNGEKKITKPFEGLVPQMQRLYEQTESEFTRNRIRAFMTPETCKVCDGARLKPETLAVTIKDRQGRELNIHQFSQQTVEDALRFIADLNLTEQQHTIVTEVVREIQSRLEFLAEVGLGYLTLNRESGTLSGGEATVVDDILRRALFRHFYNSKDKPGAHKSIRGLEQIDKVVVIDQSPIGRTPRSNPVTYTGAFTPIRELFAQLPAARVRGYDAGRFSFNVKGGRCENCEGGGLIKIEMHFLPDVYVECEVCRGKRYNRETLEITYKGRNIADVLDLTIDEAARFFHNVPSISEKLNSLLDVGLGYLRLGQAGTTLSGGEAQRVKLATELAKRATGRTVYILDEPTTGLHFSDIEKLLQVLMKLRNAGNTHVVIEHNLEMIKCADWIIDLGPEGGEGGGDIVGEGPPEKIAELPRSYTAQYLRTSLKNT